MEDKLTEHFTIDNRISEIPVLSDKIEELAAKWNLPDSLTLNINLVVEEALSNIIFYAFHDEKKHRIRISISLKKDMLKIRISDNGMAFDPTMQQQPDISLPAIERPIGGLGIFLISKIMDSVSYARKNNRNTLTLQKGIRYEYHKRDNK